MDVKLVVQRLGLLFPQSQIAKGLTVLAVILALYQLSQISWQLLPTPDAPELVPWEPQPTSGKNEPDGFSVKPITELKLFGNLAAPEEVKLEKVPEPELIQDAPKTTLRILLTGLVASNNQQKGIAIIENSGNQETYGIEDKISGTNATLHEVYADRAIILNAGRLETLMLDGMEFTKETNSRTEQLKRPQTPISNKPSPASSGLRPQQVQDLRDDLLKNPGKITDYLSISPVRQGGELKGYRLNPGRNRDLFNQSGLKANDLAVSMNGYDLTNMGESMQLMAELQELTDLSAIIERDGQLIEITLGLPR